MSDDKKDAALNHVKDLARRAEKSRERFLVAQANRDQSISVAQGRGATYQEISSASGLSMARVKQVLAENKTR